MTEAEFIDWINSIEFVDSDGKPIPTEPTEKGRLTMKKVIEGKIYNTETAEEVHSWENHYYSNDFHHCEETLYRTKKGAWFLAGSGGAMSKYSRTCGSNSWTGGDGMEVLTDAEAQAWLEDHGADADLIQRYFPNVEEA